MHVLILKFVIYTLIKVRLLEALFLIMGREIIFADLHVSQPTVCIINIDIKKIINRK